MTIHYYCTLPVTLTQTNVDVDLFVLVTDIVILAVAAMTLGANAPAHSKYTGIGDRSVPRPDFTYSLKGAGRNGTSTTYTYRDKDSIAFGDRISITVRLEYLLQSLEPGIRGNPHQDSILVPKLDRREYLPLRLGPNDANVQE